MEKKLDPINIDYESEQSSTNGIKKDDAELTKYQIDDIDKKYYGIAKPKRIKISANIIHD